MAQIREGGYSFDYDNLPIPSVGGITAAFFVWYDFDLITCGATGPWTQAMCQLNG